MGRIFHEGHTFSSNDVEKTLKWIHFYDYFFLKTKELLAALANKTLTLAEKISTSALPTALFLIYRRKFTAVYNTDTSQRCDNKAKDNLAQIRLVVNVFYSK